MIGINDTKGGAVFYMTKSIFLFIAAKDEIFASNEKAINYYKSLCLNVYIENIW